ncbi:SDR family NAD(P)-dependent oxidoreductase [Kribbella sandramycini]|uniref:SDR family NAD(P)-dependent oxidoreductase n=1 Tax=Kribbella sandramycini TaxID=60450 RepID=A0A7Y4P198_9ACTN|nr:SDR family NAD(P)-dependent oxidoreductase [Kribbella sandramycini]MBB6566607.1 short-subunit dehydrogenase [Kribbella sandramycini]NOL42738.1 SDR family NAD(P)-dependent oxidoreductase [Kribbella sandramycini]
MTHVELPTAKFGPWAVVTGASAGIGREFARQLAAGGLNVVISARRAAPLAELGAELEQQYDVRHRAVVADMSQPNGPHHLIEATADLDVGLLVSNAGDLVPGEFLGRELQYAFDSWQLNAGSHLVLTHHFGQRLAERGAGGVLLVGAAGAESGIPWAAAHAAAKAYTNTLARGLHAEFAERGLNLTVLTPGPTRTELQSRRALPETGGTTVSNAVSTALKALKAGDVEVTPGLAARVLNSLPASMSRRISGRTMAAAAQSTVSQ